jgi:hypothetical protein
MANSTEDLLLDCLSLVLVLVQALVYPIAFGTFMVQVDYI